MMDLSTNAKDVMRCDLCETAVVQMHCDTCLVNLCKACVGEHMIFDATKSHKISKKDTLGEAKLTKDPRAQDVIRCNNCNTHEIHLHCEACCVYLCATHAGKHIFSDQAKDHKIVTLQSRKANLLTKQDVDFPVTLCFDPTEVANVVTVLRRIEDIYPEASDASLTHHLLQSLHLDEFKNRLKSLESRVILVDPSNLCHANEGRVCIYRVEVKATDRKLTVYEPKVSLDQFRSIHHLPKAFLVISNSESVIDSKQAIDEKYHHMLEENKVSIFHEYDPDKKLLFCLKHTINSFIDRIENTIYGMPMRDLEEIVNYAADTAFSEKEIQTCCQNIGIVSGGNNIGSVRDGSYFCRSPFIIRRVKNELISETLKNIGKEFTNMLLIGILKDVQKMLEKEFSQIVCKIKIRNNFMIPQGIFLIGTLVSFFVQYLNPLLGIIISVATILPGMRTFVQPVNVNSVQWRNKVANEILINISEKKEEIIADVFRKLKTICVQTVQELREISVKLASASGRISLVD